MRPQAGPRLGWEQHNTPASRTPASSYHAGEQGLQRRKAGRRVREQGRCAMEQGAALASWAAPTSSAGVVRACERKEREGHIRERKIDREICWPNRCR